MRTLRLMAASCRSWKRLTVPSLLVPYSLFFLLLMGGQVWGQTITKDLPLNVDVCVGGNGTDYVLFVQTDDNAAYLFDWEEDDGSGFNNLPNGNGTGRNSYLLQNVELADNGNEYRVNITLGGNTITSNVMVLNIPAATAGTPPTPVFNSQPTGACENESIDLTVEHGSNSSFTGTFVWYWGNNNNTLDSLTVTQTIDAGPPVSSMISSPNLLSGSNRFIVQAIKTDGCRSRSAFHTITTSAKPAIPGGVSTYTSCGPGTINITVGGVNNNTMNLYDNGGSLVATQNISSNSAVFTNVSVPTSTTFTVEQVDGGCASDPKTITVTVSTLPADPTNTSVTAGCVGESVTFSATPASGSVIHWFSSAGATTNPIATGNTLVVTLGGSPVNRFARSFNNGSGCISDAVQITATPNPSPVADISAPNDACEDVAVSFDGTGSTGSGLTYAWDLDGDGQTDDGTSPTETFTYNTPGTYTITLEVTSNNCSTTDTWDIEIHAKPVSAFTFTPTSGCVGVATNFSDASTSVDPITSRLWTFADGNTSGGGNPNHTYSAAGSYSVTLTVSTAFCANFISPAQTVVINDLPSVSVPGNIPAALCNNDAVITLSPGTPSGGSWSGDGVSGNEFDPQSVAVGNPALTYTYTDGNGCTNTATTNIAVNAVPNVSAPPLDGECDGATVVTLPDGSPGNGSWFGPQVTGTDQFDPSVGPGVYSLNYTFVNGNGCSDTASTTIEVYELPSLVPNPPDTLISVCVNGGSQALPEQTDLTIFWSIQSGALGNDEIVQNGTDWSFIPDETINTLRLVSVRATLTDDNTGCIQVEDHFIFVTQAPVADFTISDECQNQFITPVDASTGPPNSWAWDFGDGTATETGQSPSHKYSAAGNFTITLTVDNGCTNETSLLISIYEIPDARFTRDNAQPCPDSLVQFTNNSIAGQNAASLSYVWDFGNGDQSTEEAPGYVYPTANAATEFDVVLIVSETIGGVPGLVCRDTTTRNVDVRSKPTAGFTPSIDPVCFTDPVILTNTSTPGEEDIVSYQWNSGDGQLRGGAGDFTILYEDLSGGNTFTASLTVIDDEGCGDVFEQVLTVDNSGPAINEPPVKLGPDILVSTDDQVDNYRWFKICNGDTTEIDDAAKGNRQFYCVPAEEAQCSFYVITSNGGSSCTTSSQSVKLDGRESLPISFLGLPLGLTIYPNPNAGKFQLDLLHQAQGAAELRILNLAGQQVFGQLLTKEQSFQSWEVLTPSLSEGMYVLEVRMAGGLRFTEKMMVR